MEVEVEWIEANSGLSGGGKEKGKKEDDCGVFEATEDGFGVEENCEYVHETVSIPLSLLLFLHHF